MANRTALFSRKQPGGVFTIDDLQEHPGDIYFVDSGSGTDGAGYGKDPDSPFDSLDYAVGQCTANQGDVIYVMPGHAENLAADSDVDIDVAGVTVIGLGKGADRPTFTATAAAGDFKLAAASVHVENILFIGGIDATTGIVEVSGNDCVLNDIEYRDSTGQATDIIVTDTADRLLIDGLRVIGAAGDGGDTAVMLNGCDDVVIRNFDLGAIECRTAACARVWIHSGYIWTAGSEDLGVKDTVTGSTGAVGPDLFIRLADDADNITEAVTGATFHVFDPVYVVNANNQKATLIDWTASA